MIEEKLKEVIEAKKRIVEGSLIIWNARLETLVHAGHYREVLNALASGVEPSTGNNCPTNNGCPCPNPPETECPCPEPEDYGCGCGCGDLTADWLGKSISPVVREAPKEAVREAPKEKK